MDRPIHGKGQVGSFFGMLCIIERPLSIITARGHEPETIKEGIGILKSKGHLSRQPNYLSVYPVSHLDVRRALGDDNISWSTARLKQEAIKFSVRQAFEIYG